MRQMIPALLGLCLLAGCGAAPAPEPAPEAEPVSPVYTDWSKLTPYEPPEPLYAYFQPYSGSRPLQPRDDYGPLLPYVGAEAGDGTYLYGLVTCDGRLVTEPVYFQITTLYDSVDTPRFLLLRRTEGDPSWFSDSGSTRIWVDNCVSVAAAAPDGSWVEAAGYRAAEPVDDTHLALYQEDSSITILDDTGAVSAFFPGETLVQWMGSGFWFWDDAGSPEVVWQDGVGTLYDGIDGTPIGWLDSSTGTISSQAPAGFDPDASESGPAEAPAADGYAWLTRIRDRVTGQSYFVGHRREDSRTYDDLLDSQGHPLYVNWSGEHIIAGGMISVLEADAFSYVSLETGEAAFRFPIRTRSD